MPPSYPAFVAEAGFDLERIEQLERDADRTMSLRALPGTVAYAFLAAGFSLASELGSRFPRFSWGMTAAAVAAGALRYAVLERTFRAPSSAAWRRAWIGTSYLCVGLWALHVSAATHLLGVGMTTILMSLASTGLAAGVAHALSPRLSLMRGCSVVLMAPLVASVLAAGGGSDRYGLAALIAMMLVYVLFLGKRLGIEYWEAAVTSAQLVIGRDELLRSQRQLLVSERLAALGTLAAGVGHEINNPLTYVLSNLELAMEELQRGSSPSTSTELVELLEDALTGAQRVRVIVRELSVFSRAEGVPSTVDVAAVIATAMKMTANEVRSRARFVHVPSNVPMVVAEDAKLGQVLVNLVMNAVHATPEDRPDKNEIRIATRVDPTGHVVIEVSDTGAGIAEATLSRIFDPFFTTKPVGAGTGLGLSICHSSVRSFGGDISVTSELGRGTTFAIRLLAAASMPPRPPLGRLERQTL